MKQVTLTARYTVDIIDENHAKRIIEAATEAYLEAWDCDFLGDTNPATHDEVVELALVELLLLSNTLPRPLDGASSKTLVNVSTAEVSTPDDARELDIVAQV